MATTRYTAKEVAEMVLEWDVDGKISEDPKFEESRIHTLLSFQNSMTFHDLFHNLSEFSMTKGKQLFS